MAEAGSRVLARTAPARAAAGWVRDGLRLVARSSCCLSFEWVYGGGLPTRQGLAIHRDLLPAMLSGLAKAAESV